MKKQKIFGAMTAVTLLCLGLASCGSDPIEVTQMQSLQIPDVTTSDPTGTVVVKFQKGSSSNEQSVGVGKIYVDNAGNFTSDPGQYYGTYYANGGIEFASVGKVNGLGSIKTIPSGGWSENIAVVAGTGYIVQRRFPLYINGESNYVDFGYARMYVVSVSSTEVTVKYQYPIPMPIKLDTSEFTFDSNGGSIIVGLEIATTFEIVSQPAWCQCQRFQYSGITISVGENRTGQSRTGEIVLKNDVNSAKITIVQEG